MPNYDYKCDSCGHAFEEFLAYEAREKPTGAPCPKCGDNEVKKIIGGFPGLAADTNMTPDKKTGGQWSEMMGRIKSSTPKRYHTGIDRATNRSGRRWKG